MENCGEFSEVMKVVREKYGWQMVVDTESLASSIVENKINTTVKVKSYFTRGGKIESKEVFQADLKEVMRELGIKSVA